MCGLCESFDNGFNLLNATTGYSGLEIAISSKGMLRVRYYPTTNEDSLYEAQDVVNINYCPICGKKLNNS